MYTKFLKFVFENNLILKNEKILLSVSGGADSMAMLHLFLRLREDYKNEIAVCHINHGLRGEESDGDEDFVKKFSLDNGIIFFSKKVYIGEISRQKKMTIEEAGRFIRYDFLNEILNKLNYNKIATAHNKNDNAETILMNIIRGGGTSGVSGIVYKRDNIIRPILIFSRDEIEDYLRFFKINFRKDSTNDNNIYFRNKIRNELLPYLKINFNNKIFDSIIRLGESAKEDSEFIDKIVKQYIDKYCIINECSVIIKKDVFNFQNAILNRIIRESVNLLKDSLSNIERKHIKDVLILQKLQTGKMINLPENIIAINSYGDIIIKYNENFSKEKLFCELNLGNNIIENFDYCINIDIINKDTIKDLDFIKNKDPLLKFFDFNKIENKKIILRNAATHINEGNDFFNPLGSNGKKKLNKYFIDKKIPRDERDSINLICFGEDIGWVVNHQISNKFKLNEETKKVLRIEFKKRSTYKSD